MEVQLTGPCTGAVPFSNKAACSSGNVAALAPCDAEQHVVAVVLNTTAGQRQLQKACLTEQVTKGPPCHRLLPPMHFRETLSLSWRRSDRLAGLKCTVSCVTMVRDLQEGSKP